MPNSRTIKPGNRDFPVSRVFQETMDGVHLTEPRPKLPRTGKKMFGDDGLFMFYIRPGTEITEETSFMFTHNMDVINERAARSQTGGKESKV